MVYSAAMSRDWIRFDRNELAGAFGDIGTDLPLIVGMILAAGLDSASVLIMFGVMQVFTGLRYGIPMPVQPLKAMAVLVIAQKLSGSVLFGGGLVIGVIMLVFTLTGLIEWLARVVPKTVVRGIQFGLGLQLASLALKDYVQADGAAGYVLAAVGFVITIALLGNRRFPAALFVIALGIVYAFIFKIDFSAVWHGARLHLPRLQVLTRQDLLTGLVVLAMPQIPLSLGNSILATRAGGGGFFPRASLDGSHDQFHVLDDESDQSVVWRHPDLSWIGRDGGALHVRSAHRGLGCYLRMPLPGAGAVFRRMFRTNDPGFSKANPWCDAGI